MNRAPLPPLPAGPWGLPAMPATVTALFVLLVGVVSPVRAQEAVTLLAAPDESGVRLRWTLPESELPDAGFVIEREDEAGGVRTFTVPSPMPRAEAVDRNLIGDEEYGELVEAFARDDGLDDEARRQRDFNRATLTLITVTRPAWAEVLGTIFEDTTAAPGTEYTYRVTTTVAGATVVVGEARVTAGDAELLPTIDGLAAEADPNGVNLRWELPEEGFVVGYRVYRTDPDGAERDLTGDGLFVSRQEDPETGELRLPDVFLQDTAVQANTTYEYAVAGVDVFGRRTPRSESVSVLFPDPEPLEVPLVTAVDVRDREIELFWAPPADERVAGIAVLRGEDPTEEPELLTPEPLPPSATSWTDTLARGGVSYYYSLASLDVNGRRFGPSPPWATRGINLSPPSAPTELTLTATEESLELSWEPPPEQDIRGYQLFIIRRDGDAGDEHRDDRGGDGGGGEADGRRVLVTDGLVTGTQYAFDVPPGTLDELTFAVRAVNTSFVEGPLSDPVSGRVIDVVPPDPPILGRIRAGEGRVSVSWVYTSDPDVAGYRVLRSVQGERAAGERGEDGRDAENGDPFATVRSGLAPGDTVFVDSAVTPGLLHAYTVEAIDASGNVSERAVPLAATPYRLTPPEPPRNVRARLLEDGGVAVSWEPAGSDDVPFHVVERSTGGGRFVQVGDPLPPGTREFTDPTGRAGLSYRVVPIDGAGNLGEPSEEATVRE